MDDEAALLRAICEHPDEDTPRLVFADWLQEQGGTVNVAWALAIRAQVAVARGNSEEITLQRARVLELAFGQSRILARLGLTPQLNVTAWERGFPIAVTIEFSALAANWPVIAARVPVRKVYVHYLSGGEAAAFVTWPGLERIRELTFSVYEESSGDVLPRLADCPALRGLESLSVLNSPLTEADAVALLDSSSLGGLKALDVDYGWSRGSLTPQLETRLVARFGPNVISDDEVIPF